MKKFFLSVLVLSGLFSGIVFTSPSVANAQPVYNGGYGLPKLILCGSSFPEGSPNRTCTVGHAFDTLKNLIQFVMIILVPIAVGWFVWAGFQYLTANGDKGKVEMAKTTFKNVFIGFAIIFLAWIVIYTILNEILDSSKGFTPLQINSANQ